MYCDRGNRPCKKDAEGMQVTSNGAAVKKCCFQKHNTCHVSYENNKDADKPAHQHSLLYTP